MMKQIISFMCGLALLFFASCSHDDNRYDTPPNTGSGVTFIFDIDGQQGAGTKAATDIDFKSTWETGDEVGLFALIKDGNPASTADVRNHAKLTRQTDGSWQGDAVYYPVSGEALDFYAYYPYNSTYTCPDDVKGHTVATDQRTAANHNPSDLLLAKALDQSGTTVSLGFVHVLSMVQVTVTSGDYVPAFREGDDGFRVILEDVATSLSAIDWSSLSVSTVSAGKTDITMYPLPTTDGSYVYRAIVPAQQFAAQKNLMRFVQDAQGNKIDFSYAPAVQKTADARQAGTYNVKLDYELDPDHVYALGDVFPYKGTPIGIVWKISNGGKNGCIVSLDETSAAWKINGKPNYATTQNDGLANMATIKAQDEDFGDYPAAAWVDGKNPPGTSYTSGAKGVWYFPSRNQMNNISGGFGKEVFDYGQVPFKNGMISAGGVAVDYSEYYWTSTLSFFSGDFFVSTCFLDGSNTGNRTNGSTDRLRVRAFMDF